MEPIILPHLGRRGLRINPIKGLDARVIADFQKISNNRIYDPKPLRDVSERVGIQEDAVKMLLRGLTKKGENSGILIQGGPNQDISSTLEVVEKVLNKMYQDDDFIPASLGTHYRTLVPTKRQGGEEKYLVSTPSEIVAGQNFQRPNQPFTLSFESIREAREFKKDIDILSEFVIQTLKQPEFQSEQICSIKNEKAYDRDYTRLEKKLVGVIHEAAPSIEGFDWDGKAIKFKLVGGKGNYGYDFDSADKNTKNFLKQGDQHTREQMYELFAGNFEEYIQNHELEYRKLRQRHTAKLTNSLLCGHILAERIKIAEKLKHHNVESRIQIDHNRNSRKKREELLEQASNHGKVDYFIEILREKWDGDEVRSFLNHLYDFTADPTVLRRLKEGETQIRESTSGRHDFISLVRPVIGHEISDPDNPFTIYIESNPTSNNVFGSLDDTIYTDQPEHQRAILSPLSINSAVYFRNAHKICKEGGLVQKLRAALKTGSFEIPRDFEGTPKNLNFRFNLTAKIIFHFDESPFSEEEVEENAAFEELKTHSPPIHWPNYVSWKDERERRDKEQKLINVLKYELELKQEDNPQTLAKYSVPALNTLLTVAKAIERKNNRLTTDQDKLLNFANEVSSYVSMELRRREVLPKHIYEYLHHQKFENSRYQDDIEDFLDFYSLPPTDKAIGKLCGLHVYDGDYFMENGYIVLLEASLSPGTGQELISVQTDAELMDSSYIKGTGDATAFIQERFKKPIYFDTRLTYRNFYEESGGPSASAAEVYVVLSKLANLELCQKTAVTGTISNPSGDIGAIGGVYGKVRAAYDDFKALCNKHKKEFEGYRVLIPPDNVEEFLLKLQLDPALTKEISSGNFKVLVHNTVDDGIKILSDKTLSNLEDTISGKIEDLGHQSREMYVTR